MRIMIFRCHSFLEILFNIPYLPRCSATPLEEGQPNLKTLHDEDTQGKTVPLLAILPPDAYNPMQLLLFLFT